MRIFAKIVILMFLLTTVGELCSHAIEPNECKDIASTELLDEAGCHCGQDDACHHDACCCQCLCHVPAAAACAAQSDLLLIATGHRSGTFRIDTADAASSLYRPPISA